MSFKVNDEGSITRVKRPYESENGSPHSTTELHFTLHRITLNHHYLSAFVAQGTPYAFHLAPDEQHYQISHLGMCKTLDIDFDHYQECEEEIALFVEAQEVVL